MIEPAPPVADLQLSWDTGEAGDPVAALRAARARLGDTFAVESGGVTYLFTFGEAGLRAFYALEEREASKGLADYRMLVRKMPDELFAERRTFAHDLFGADEVHGYLDNLDWAVDTEIAALVAVIAAALAVVAVRNPRPARAAEPGPLPVGAAPALRR